METVLTTSADKAADIIKAGGICAFPTETVHGLGADVFNAEAIARIFEAKRRPPDNPLIAHISSIEQLYDLARTVPPAAMSLIDRFFPGPLTLVLKKQDRVPDIASAGLDTIGIRMPAARLASQFIFACGTPLAAPSANLSGRPSPTTWQAVFEDMAGRVDCILQGEPTEIGLESTVVDCTGEYPVLLRRGSVSLDELRETVGDIRSIDDKDSGPARSPGLLHRHYSPSASVRFWTGDQARVGTTAFIGISEAPAEFAKTRICEDLNDYGRSLFEYFRECDRAGIDVIYCEPVDDSGIGAALMDRIRRASE